MRYQRFALFLTLFTLSASLGNAAKALAADGVQPAPTLAVGKYTNSVDTESGFLSDRSVWIYDWAGTEPHLWGNAHYGDQWLNFDLPLTSSGDHQFSGNGKLTGDTVAKCSYDVSAKLTPSESGIYLALYLPDRTAAANGQPCNGMSFSWHYFQSLFVRQ